MTAARRLAAWWDTLDERVRDFVLLCASAPLAYAALCGAFAL